MCWDSINSFCPIVAERSTAAFSPALPFINRHVDWLTVVIAASLHYCLRARNAWPQFYKLNGKNRPTASTLPASVLWKFSNNNVAVIMRLCVTLFSLETIGGGRTAITRVVLPANGANGLERFGNSAGNHIGNVAYKSGTRGTCSSVACQILWCAVNVVLTADLLRFFEQRTHPIEHQSLRRSN